MRMYLKLNTNTYYQVQVYDISFELNEVEARLEEYPSTLSYLKLRNIFIPNKADTSDKGVRYV